DDHVADLLGRRAGLHVMPLFLFAGAAKSCKRTGAAVVLARQGAGDGELATLALVVAPATARASRLWTTRHRREAGRAANGGTLFLLLSRRCGRRRLLGLSWCLGSATRFFLGLNSGLLDGSLFSLAIVFGAAALFLVRRAAGLLLAAARLFEPRHACLFRLA